MSEIKSTLDLVMERTKDLFMNETEKENHRLIELKKRLAGLIQKVDDQAMKPNELIEQLDELKEKFGPDTATHIVETVLNGVGLNNDCSRRLSLLADTLDLDVSAISKVIDEYLLALDDLKNGHIEVLLSAMSDRHQISGTAVVPNIDADPVWHKKHLALTNRFSKQLEIEKQRMINE